MTHTEIVRIIDGGAYGKVVARTTATLPDKTEVNVVGVQFEDGVVHFCEEERIADVSYTASVSVDYDATVDTVEEAAGLLIDWIRGDSEGPIHVDVRLDGENEPSRSVAVTFNEQGRAVGTLTTERSHT